MLPYAHFLINGTSIPHGTHGVDMTGYYRTHIFSAMRHTYNIWQYLVFICPGDIVRIYVNVPDCCK